MRPLLLHPLTGSNLKPGMHPHLVHHLPVVLALRRLQAALDPQHRLRVTGDQQPRPLQAIPCFAMARRSCTPRTIPVPNVKIRATRTMIRRTRAANAGTASASHLRRFSLRARGLARAAGLRARASVAARSSAHCPHSGLHKRAHHRRQLYLVRILRQLVPLRECSSATPALGLYRLELCPRRARPSSCRAIHGSAGDCAGDVVDAGRLRS